jgi:glycosyltransferase involved in cell wall biosynthesis
MVRMMKVATGLAYGGAETQLKNLALRLKQRGWSLSVVSMLPPKAYVDELESAGICVYNLRMRRKVPDPRALFRFCRILRHLRPQIVHSYMFHANLLARVARLITPVPILVSSVRGLNEGGRLRDLAYRFTDPLADITTQVSEAGKQRYIRVGAVPPSKIVYIPNGIDTSRFHPNPTVRKVVRESLGYSEEIFVWLTVGRLEPVKNHRELIQAFCEVVSEYPHARLLIAGQGPLHPVLEQQIAASGLSTHVRLLGIRHDIPELLNAADAFVLPSLWEGMSNALLEAAATALPIVATNIGGNPEVVLDGVSGYLVPPSEPAALTEAMGRLLGIPKEQRLGMGLAGRAHVVQNFDLERVVDRWEALYRELLQQKGNRVGITPTRVAIVAHYAPSVARFRGALIRALVRQDIQVWVLAPDFTPTTRESSRFVLEPITFTLAARLLREKGIVEFAQAAQRIKQHYSNTRFLLLGGLDTNPGALREHEVRQWAEAGILEWHGHVPDVRPYFVQTSVYVLPSYYREGVPRSTQEAMAMARPVITTDAPGCRETVVDGVNGFLVPPRDVDALIAAMERFILQPELILSMGQASRKLAEERFDVHKINQRILEVMGISPKNAEM